MTGLVRLCMEEVSTKSECFVLSVSMPIVLPIMRLPSKSDGAAKSFTEPPPSQ